MPRLRGRYAHLCPVADDGALGGDELQEGVHDRLGGVLLPVGEEAREGDDPQQDGGQDDVRGVMGDLEGDKMGGGERTREMQM